MGRTEKQISSANVGPDFKWGTHPSRVFEQVKNTASFLIDDPSLQTPFLNILRAVPNSTELFTQNLPTYFRLCIAAHFSTVATLVPTDLDRTIRLKLWKFAQPKEIEEMVDSVLEFKSWDESCVSKKRVISASGKLLTGHFGEWFTIAIPALLLTRTFSKERAAVVEDSIESLIAWHRDVYEEFLTSAKEAPLNLARAASLLAHNFGDLDQVIDLWNLSSDDPVRKKFYNAHHFAGSLNKQFMADENHRHYPLREARPLRKSFDFILPFGPFFDEWGESLAKHPQLDVDEIAMIAEALIDGFEKLNKTKPVLGYARALTGLLQGLGRNQKLLFENLPSSKRKILEGGRLREAMTISKERFENSFAQRILKFIKTADSKNL